MEYDLLSGVYTGWTLTEIKAMPMRERKYWIELNRWRAEKKIL